MADPTQVQDAQDQAKQQSAALLQAIAEQGSRGAALYGQAAAQAQADRATALQSAVARAQGQGGPGAPGAPAALTAQLSAQATQPADQQAAGIAQAQTAFNQDQTSLTDANNNYMNQLVAAVPIVQSRTDAQVAQLKAQAEQAAQQRALQAQLAQLQLQQEQAALDNTRQAGANESARAADQRAADAAQNKRDSVSQQKLDAANAMQKNQNDLEAWAQGMGNGTGRAFLDLVGNDKDLPLALSHLDEAIAAQNPGYKGDPYSTTDPQSMFFAKYGTDADVTQLKKMLTTYFNGPSDAPGPATALPHIVF